MNYGVDRTRGIVVAFGDQAVPLRAISDLDPALAGAPTLNALLDRGRTAWTALHEQLAASDLHPHLMPITDLDLGLPFDVADYVDFYASIHHATNLGRLLRPGTEPLLPNWRHLPVSYHGRSGTVIVSGTPVRRPAGIVARADGPVYQPTEQLDIELEVGVVVGGSTSPGEPVDIDHAADHIFGLVLLNDWSARDIQAFEYQPLGPHLGKSFATSMSAWVTPVADLEPFRMAAPPQDPRPAAHLRTDAPWAIDIGLRVLVESADMRVRGLAPVEISTTNFTEMYWTVAQLLAHVTSNGAALRSGDLLGSGTVSGPERGTEGSLIELSWAGERPLELPDGSTRSFLADGDRVILEGMAGGTVPLGAVEGEILPALTR